MKKVLPVISALFLMTIFCCSNQAGETNQQESSPTGVQFVNLSIPDALVKAKTENKIILVDFFSPT